MNIIIKAKKYFKNLNNFLKKRQPTLSKKLSRERAFGILRGTASYAALLGAVVSLGWLSQTLEAVPQVSLSPWDLNGIPLVVIDAGHGGHDGGAVAGGTIEKELALTLSLRLRDLLVAHGLRVKMTRHTDVFLPLEERASLANEAGAAVFVSLHLNTSEVKEVSGIETYYTEQKALSVQRALQARLGLGNGSVQDRRGHWLAENLQRQAVRATGAEDRGIKQRNYAVVSRTQIPAALIECGFLTHPDEAARLKTADYQQKLITGIAAGIAEFLKAHHGSPDRGIQAADGSLENVTEVGENKSP